MTSIKILLVAAICFLVEKFYFSLAERYNIIDKPNHRTLHEVHTIRGGGIIFPVSVIFYSLFFGMGDWSFLTGLLLVSVISFIDDLGHVKSLIRFLGQFTGLGLLMVNMQWMSYGWIVFVLVLVVATGVLNAYNFMDGINGITGGYSTVAVLSFLYVNEFVVHFVSSALLFCLLAGLMVFNYFNFRNKARCFAGDVGSVSMAFIVIYLLLKLIYITANPLFVLLLAVYGVDSVLTILHRLSKKENIFEAHRSHLFQVLVFHGRHSHLQISFVYMMVQFLLDIVIIYAYHFPPTVQMILSGGILLILILGYILLKRHYLRLVIGH